jgi:hypothetical protein
MEIIEEIPKGNRWNLKGFKRNFKKFIEEEESNNKNLES